MITCDNCGEQIRHHGEGEITCDTCGVVQQSFSQTVIEEFSASYSQTQKIGRLKPTQPKEDEGTTDEDAESRDFHFIIGIQMVLENLSKTLVNSFGFSNQVEVEAKDIWARYLTFVVENEVPISNMFSDPLTNGQKYYVDSNYMRNTFQVPPDSENYRIPKRMNKAISEMGKTSFEYATMVCVLGGDADATKKNQEIEGEEQKDTAVEKAASGNNDDSSLGKKKKRPKLYDYADVNAYLEGSDVHTIFNGVIDTGMELPRSRRCSPTGFALYMLENMLIQRQIPISPTLPYDCISLEPSNPYRIAYMMGTLYRHDFLWRLMYAYPHLEPLDCFSVLRNKYGIVTKGKVLTTIAENPLELSEVCRVADSFGIPYDPEKYKKRRHHMRRLRIELIDKIYMRLVDTYFKGHQVSDMLSFNISWIAPKMDLQLVCSIIFLALLRCRYPVVASDVLRWVIQGRIPLRTSASLLPDRILRAAFREGKLAPRMKYATNQQEEVAYNLFTKTTAPSSLGCIEMITSRLLLCGIFINPEDPESTDILKYNVHGLCRRIVHHLRLPSHVLPVADMIVNCAMRSENQEMTSDSLDSGEYKHNLIRRLRVIYGTCLGEYPVHVFAVACVLAACRMLWPVFHYNAPAYPTSLDTRCREDFKKESETASTGCPAVDKTSESYIIKRDRFPHVIEFDPNCMAWIVRLAVRLSSQAPAPIIDAIMKHNGLGPEKQRLLTEFSMLTQDPLEYYQMASMLAAGTKKAEGNDIFQSLCETINVGKELELPKYLDSPDDIAEGSISKELFFDAKDKGYSRAGIIAWLWTLYHLPSAGLKACLTYVLGYDSLALRQMSLSHLIRSKPFPLLKHILQRYNHRKYFNKVDQELIDSLQTPEFIKLWLNLGGQWSGSLVSCLGLDEEGFTNAITNNTRAYSESIVVEYNNMEAEGTRLAVEQLAEWLDQEDETKQLASCIPGNRWMYHMLTKLFFGYGFYASWSPEKSLELESYMSMISNQREQVLDGVKEMLATKLAGEETSAWSHLWDNLEGSMRCETNDSPSWTDSLLENCCHSTDVGNIPDIEDGEEVNRMTDAYRKLKDHVNGLFQDLGTVTETGRQLPSNPWRDYNSLRSKFLFRKNIVVQLHYLWHTLLHSRVSQAS